MGNCKSNCLSENNKTNESLFSNISTSDGNNPQYIPLNNNSSSKEFEVSEMSNDKIVEYILSPSSYEILFTYKKLDDFIKYMTKYLSVNDLYLITKNIYGMVIF